LVLLSLFLRRAPSQFFPKECQLTPKQAHAARVLLSWSPEHLAREAGLGLSSVYDFEAGRRNVSPEYLGKLKQALERGGIQFTNGAKPGVRLVG
jgi:transcriptional regulator with XRE-family HTH domain